MYMYKRENPYNFIKNREKVKLPYIMLQLQKIQRIYISKDGVERISSISPFYFIPSFRWRIDAEINSKKKH